MNRLPTEDPDILSTSLDENVLTIRLTNARSRNPISQKMRALLGQAVEYAEKEPDVRAVLLAAEGGTFCSGGDLSMLQAQSDPWSVYRRFQGFSRWLVPLIKLEKMVVVALNGSAVGGGLGLALAGDVIVAGKSAKLLPAFFRIGAIPDVAVMYHLPRLIGMAGAKKLLFSTEGMSAQEACELGIVTRVVDDSDVQQAALDEAIRLSRGPVEAMGLAKRIMARSFESNLDDMLSFEAFGQALAMSAPDFKERLNTLLQRGGSGSTQALPMREERQ